MMHYMLKDLHVFLVDLVLHIVVSFFKYVFIIWGNVTHVPLSLLNREPMGGNAFPCYYDCEHSWLADLEVSLLIDS